MANRRDRRAAAKQGGGGGAPSDPAAQYAYQMAGQSLAAGRLAEAESLYRQTLESDAKHVPSLYQLGVIALQTGRSEAAAELFRKCIALSPRIAEAHASLGIALFKLGRFDAALKSGRRALELKPGYAEAHNNIGLTLQQMHRHAEAAAQFRKALALKSEPHYWQNLALSCRELGRFDEAVACFEAAVAQAPQAGEIHRNLGSMLLSLGRIEPARQALRQAIARDPGDTAAWHFLANAGRMTLEDFAGLERASADMARLTADQQINLNFALGQALTEAGERDRGFGHFLAGNAIRRQQDGYNEAAALNALARMPDLIGPDFFARHRDAGDKSATPVFILGMPRSGTTLAEQVLAGHPQVFAGGERSDFGNILRDSFATDGASFAFLDRIETLTARQLRDLGAAYLATLKQGAPASAQRITDKLPLNFRFVGLIHAALPNARIIHMRRDAVDTCLSCFTQLFTARLSFANDLAELGRYWKAYDRLMAHWRAVLPQGVMLDMRYEDLVGDFENQARRIVAHCGLEWDPACLSSHTVERAVTTASWVQVRQPVHGRSVGKWRPAADVLKPLTDALES